MRHRLLLLTFAGMAAPPTAAARPGLRAPPPNDNTTSATSIILPGIFLVTGSMDESTAGSITLDNLDLRLKQFSVLRESIGAPLAMPLPPEPVR